MPRSKAALVPILGPSVPRRGSLFSKALGRAVLRVLGWEIEGDLPDIPKSVFIVAPHTSSWDFPIAIGVMLALGLRASWLAKHTLFWSPFGRLLLWLGGIPVNRKAAGGVVSLVVRCFEESDALVLAIAPEGTRRQVAGWKSGFHRVATAARVPIVPIGFDYSRRRFWFGPPFESTHDYAADLRALQSYYGPQMARWPERYWAKTSKE